MGATRASEVGVPARVVEAEGKPKSAPAPSGVWEKSIGERAAPEEAEVSLEGEWREEEEE